MDGQKSPIQQEKNTSVCAFYFQKKSKKGLKTSQNPSTCHFESAIARKLLVRFLRTSTRQLPTYIQIGKLNLENRRQLFKISHLEIWGILKDFLRRKQLFCTFQYIFPLLYDFFSYYKLHCVRKNAIYSIKNVYLKINPTPSLHQNFVGF